MSYDMELNDPVSGELLHLDFKHDMRGGTYVVGGTTACHLNITWNYGPLIRERMHPDGLKHLHGMSAAESLSLLDKAIDSLDNDISDNYWDSTEGNVKSALMKLRAFAQLRPDGVWYFDT